MISFKAGGKSEKGGTCFVKGPQSRTIATVLNRRASASTTAFTKWVVPMATLRTSLRLTADLDKTFSITAWIPDVTSTVVGVLLDAHTPRDSESVAAMSMIAASVFVPPTSTPMRYGPLFRVMINVSQR
jgi:hypothetical protein